MGKEDAQRRFVTAALVIALASIFGAVVAALWGRDAAVVAAIASVAIGVFGVVCARIQSSSSDRS